MGSRLLTREGKLVTRDGKLVTVAAGQASACDCCGSCYLKAQPCEPSTPEQAETCLGPDILYFACDSFYLPPLGETNHFQWEGHCYALTNSESGRLSKAQLPGDAIAVDGPLYQRSNASSCDSCCYHRPDECWTGMCKLSLRTITATMDFTFSPCGGSFSHPVLSHFWQQVTSVSESGVPLVHANIHNPNIGWSRHITFAPHVKVMTFTHEDVRYVATYRLHARRRTSNAGLSHPLWFDLHIYNGDTGRCAWRINASSGTVSSSHDCYQESTVTSGCCTFREGLDVHALTVREDPQGANLPVAGAPTTVTVSGSLTLDAGTNECCSCYGGARFDRDKHTECFEESDEDVYAWNESAGNTGPCTCCECQDCAYGTRKSDTLTFSVYSEWSYGWNDPPSCSTDWYDYVSFSGTLEKHSSACQWRGRLDVTWGWGPDGDEETTERTVTATKTAYGWRISYSTGWGSSHFDIYEDTASSPRSCESYQDEWWKVEVGVNTHSESADCTSGNVNYDCCQHYFDYWDGEWWHMETYRSKVQMSVSTSDCDVQEGI